MTRFALLTSAVFVAACGNCTETAQPGEPWSLYEVEPPQPSETPSPPADCDASTPAPCADTCVIDVGGRTSTCDFSIDWDQSRFAIDMPSRDARLHLDAWICDPEGWTLHVGDSPSNNGHGGDGAEFSNDAELQFVDRDLTIYGSDRSLDAPDHVRRYPGTLAEGGCTRITAVIGDGYLRVVPACLEEESPDLLRLDADDTEGDPDRLWYVGMNRTYGSSGRSGSGLRELEVCTSTP